MHAIAYILRTSFILGPFISGGAFSTGVSLCINTFIGTLGGSDGGIFGLVGLRLRSELGWRLIYTIIHMSIQALMIAWLRACTSGIDTPLAEAETAKTDSNASAVQFLADVLRKSER